MSVCPKNSSQTEIGSDLKFAHVVLYVVRRSTVLFSIFNFQVFQLSPFPKSHTSFKLESYWKQGPSSEPNIKLFRRIGEYRSSIDKYTWTIISRPLH